MSVPKSVTNVPKVATFRKQRISGSTDLKHNFTQL